MPSRGLSLRQIAASLGLLPSTVADYLRRFHRTGLAWPLPAGVVEATLEARLFAAVIRWWVYRIGE